MTVEMSGGGRGLHGVRFRGTENGRGRSGIQRHDRRRPCAGWRHRATVETGTRGSDGHDPVDRASRVGGGLELRKSGCPQLSVAVHRACSGRVFGWSSCRLVLSDIRWFRAVRGQTADKSRTSAELRRPGRHGADPVGAGISGVATSRDSGRRRRVSSCSTRMATCSPTTASRAASGDLQCPRRAPTPALWRVVNTRRAGARAKRSSCG